jgi:DNA replication and repair protein RecF
MALIKKLSVQNFRSYVNFTIDLSPDTTVITGVNGSGKTSLLEAVYIALRGGSFKGSDIDVLQHDAPWWRIDIEFSDLSKRSVTFNHNLLASRKKFTVEGKVVSRLPVKFKYPVVLFEPDDLRLLNGSPARRRQFIDDFISQLDPIYQTRLHCYERALKQRNNLFKKQFLNRDELFAWNITLSEYGSYIIEQRIIFIERINQQINDAYNQIARSKDIVSVHYSHTYTGDIKQKMLNDLETNCERDKLLGFTSVGPHRHDVIFYFNNFPVIEVASRGEVRSIVLALKFLEVNIIKQITNQKPVVLLDDVFSELDDNRQDRLLLNGSQTVITSTKLPDNMEHSIKTIKL